jgi:hypothetical protein
MSAHNDGTEPGQSDEATPEERLARANVLLAEWAACSAAQSAPLIDRLEAMGYDVKERSREDVVEILKHPPTRTNMLSSPTEQ